MIAALLTLLLCGGLALLGPQPALVRLERPAPPGSGVVIVVQALDPQSRRLSVRRARLLIGAQSAPLERSSSNSLPPLTIADPAGQSGDCYTLTELSGPPGAPDRSVTSFAGCVWWWSG